MSSCFKSIYIKSWTPSYAVRMLLYLFSYVTPPFASISCISLNIHNYVQKLLMGYYYKMYESQLNDKIKYWQYHLKKNKKNQAKETIRKTPEKKKVAMKSMLLSNNPNSIVNTIDKLKFYLHQQEISKIESQQNTKKQMKKNSIKENDNKGKITKSISMQGTMKLSKTMVHKVKLEANNNSKSKSKSKSKQKSKAKLLKSKKSKQIKVVKQLKVEKQVKIQKKSPSKKVNRKKKNKSPSPKKWHSIKLQSPHIRQQLQTEKRWPQTANLKTDKSRFETESTHFRLWQQHEQTFYNIKRKHAKTLSIYFNSFSTFLKFNQNQKKALSSQRNSYTAFNLQTMIKSQQSKLLQLRAELGRLKDSNNLNESLEVIISKVNENISSLKKIEYSQKEDCSQQIDGGYSLAQVKSFHNSTRSVNESQKSFASDIPQVREPILMMDSLTISHDQTSHMENKHIPFRQCDNLKEQSSICLLDSKFLNVTLNNPSFIEQNALSTKKINLSLLKSPQSMLLNFQSQQSALLSSNQAKSESKLLSQISEDYESNVPIYFTVNQVKYFPVEEKSQQQSLQSQEFLIPDKDNHKLLNTINNILNDHAGKFQIDRKVDNSFQLTASYSSEQKSYLYTLILDDLVNQILPFLGSHQFLLQKLIEVYAISNENEGFNIDEQIAPIQYSNQYLLQLAEKLINHASQHYRLYDRMKNPLGVQPVVNMRYIRISLIEQYGLEGFEAYNEEDYQQQIDQQMMAVEEKAEILLKEHLENFDEFLGNQDLPQQIILNRCLYQAINNILDNFRPFGSNGLPIFYSYECQPQMLPLEAIKKNLIIQLKKYMNLRLGITFEQNKFAIDNQIQLRNMLINHNKVLRDQIQQDFKIQDEDSMERYQLMLMIENYILSQETWAIYQFFSKKQGNI